MKDSTAVSLSRDMGSGMMENSKHAFVGLMILLLVLVIFFISFFSQPEIIEDGSPKTNSQMILESILIVLVVCIVSLSLFIGYKRITDDEKRYARIVNKTHDEYELQCGQHTFYLKREELRK